MYRKLRPFPKPIREAVTMLRGNAILEQWLEWRWRTKDRFIYRFELCLVRAGEAKNSKRRLWSTSHREEAKGMQECLRKIGIVCKCGEHFGIDRGRTVEAWYMPE